MEFLVLLAFVPAALLLWSILANWRNPPANLDGSPKKRSHGQPSRATPKPKHSAPPSSFSEKTSVASPADKEPDPAEFGLTSSRISELEQAPPNTEKNVQVACTGLLALAVGIWATAEKGLATGLVMTVAGLLVFLPFGMMIAAAIFPLVRKLSPELAEYERAERYLAAKAAFDRYVNLQRREHWLNMDHRIFELEVADLFRRAGHTVVVTRAVKDEGVDVVVDDHILVQCKAHQNPVGPAVVRELYGVVLHFNAERGVIISREGFTSGARDFAIGKPISLYDLGNLVYFNEHPNQLSIAIHRQAVL